MRSVELTLPDGVAHSLGVEADLLDFDSTEVYIQWLIAHRFTIDTDGDRERLLARYADHVQELDAVVDDSPLVTQASRADDVDDVTAPDSEQAESAAGGSDDSNVDRIRDERLADTADALSRVEDTRVDKIVDDAVSQTRRRLGSNVETGIDYAPGEDSDQRLGANIVDLDSLDVPGDDPDLIERRQEVVGIALAYIRDVESAKRSDFIDELYEEYPAGYGSEDAWWDFLKRGLRQVDRVLPAHEQHPFWRFKSTPGRVTRLSE